jgi:thioredoxin 1
VNEVGNHWGWWFRLFCLQQQQQQQQDVSNLLNADYILKTVTRLQSRANPSPNLSTFIPLDTLSTLGTLHASTQPSQVADAIVSQIMRYVSIYHATPLHLDLTSQGSNVKQVSSSLLEEAVQTSSLVLVHFWAEWCGPCKMMRPVIDALASSQTNVAVVKCNVDENEGAAYKYGIRGIPTSLLFKNGQNVGRQVGFSSSAKLEQMIESNK